MASVWGALFGAPEAMPVSEIPRTDAELIASRDWLTNCLHESGVLSQNAKVVKVSFFQGKLEGVQGLGVADGVKKLTVEYYPVGAGPPTFIVKRMDVQSYPPLTKLIKGNAAPCTRAALAAMTCGPCAETCGCLTVGGGTVTLCTPTADAKRLSPLKDWEMENIFKPEARWYTEISPLLNSSGAAPGFRSARLLAGGWADRGVTHLHTWGFLYSGKVSGSFGTLILEDLSLSGGHSLSGAGHPVVSSAQPETNAATGDPFHSLDHHAAMGPHKKLLKASPVYLAGLSLKSLPSVRESLMAMALSMAEMHAFFWRGRSEHHPAGAAGSTAGLSSLCDAEYSFYQWYGPFTTGPTYVRWHSCAEKRFVSGHVARFVRICNAMVSNPSGSEMLSDPEWAKVVRDTVGAAATDGRVLAALQNIEDGRESVYSAATSEMDWGHTLCRGDSHLGNVFARKERGSTALRHFDFQFYGPGNVAAELMYCLTVSPTHTLGPWNYSYDKAFEARLLEAYHKKLCQHGGGDGYPLDALKGDFRTLAGIAAWDTAAFPDINEATGMNDKLQGVKVVKDADGMSVLDSETLVAALGKEVADFILNHGVYRYGQHLNHGHQTILQRAADWWA